MLLTARSTLTAMFGSLEAVVAVSWDQGVLHANENIHDSHMERMYCC
jgi:hypothetical protein